MYYFILLLALLLDTQLIAACPYTTFYTVPCPVTQPICTSQVVTQQECVTTPEPVYPKINIVLKCNPQNENDESPKPVPVPPPSPPPASPPSPQRQKLLSNLLKLPEAVANALQGEISL